MRTHGRRARALRVMAARTLARLRALHPVTARGLGARARARAWVAGRARPLRGRQRLRGPDPGGPRLGRRQARGRARHGAGHPPARRLRPPPPPAAAGSPWCARRGCGSRCAARPTRAATSAPTSVWWPSRCAPRSGSRTCCRCAPRVYEPGAGGRADPARPPRDRGRRWGGACGRAAAVPGWTWAGPIFAGARCRAGCAPAGGAPASPPTSTPPSSPRGTAFAQVTPQQRGGLAAAGERQRGRHRDRAAGLLLGQGRCRSRGCGCASPPVAAAGRP